MKIVNIFPSVLWSIQYERDSQSIFAKLMDQWNNIEFIDDFFNRNKKRIENSKFWKEYSFSEIVINAKAEASRFLSDLVVYYKNGESGKHPNFDDVFVVLERNASTYESRQRRKLYGVSTDNSVSVFRLYALKILPEGNEPPAYIITGGGIKIVEKMKEMRALNKEYRAMLSVQKWLETKGILTVSDLKSIQHEHYK